MILFLDIDGVLHRVGGSLFEQVSRLESVLRDHPEVELVISSSWREDYPWDVLVEIFSPDIQPRVVGRTPVIDTPWPPYPRPVRHEEILQYLSTHGEDARSWLVLDDDALLFPPDCPQLIVCAPERGFDAGAESVLRAALANAMSP